VISSPTASVRCFSFSWVGETPLPKTVRFICTVSSAGVLLSSVLIMHDIGDDLPELVRRLDRLREIDPARKHYYEDLRMSVAKMVYAYARYDDLQGGCSSLACALPSQGAGTCWSMRALRCSRLARRTCGGT